MPDVPQADKVAKFTVTLPTTVFKALKASASKQGREPYEIIQELVIDHVIAAGTLDSETQALIEANRWLVATAVNVARGRLQRGEPVDTLTADTFADCAADPEWAAKYRFYVQDDIFKNGNPRKGPINREIGFRIRAAVGAQVMKDAKGAPVLRKVLGQVIQSYTPFASYDPNQL